MRKVIGSLLILTGIILIGISVVDLFTDGLYGLDEIFVGIVFVIIGRIIQPKSFSKMDKTNNRLIMKSERNTTNNSKNKNMKTLGLLREYPSRRALMRYGKHIVYWGDMDVEAGEYDDNGNVFRNDGKRVGFVNVLENGTAEIILDRSMYWEWLLEQKVVKLNKKPAMGLLIGKNYTSYIEPVFPRPDLEWECLAMIENSGNSSIDDLISSAAYILAAEENLLDWKGNEFYLNAQNESYYLEKNGEIDYYNRFGRYKQIGILINLDGYRRNV